jgi:hypothetical protein
VNDFNVKSSLWNISNLEKSDNDSPNLAGQPKDYEVQNRFQDLAQYTTRIGGAAVQDALYMQQY